MNGHPYVWQVDHRILLVRVRGVYKASCHCGEQSPKGTEREVEEWVRTHLKEAQK
jgi:hypothetical protein